MSTEAKRTWIIFESRNGNPASRNGGWLDYCREELPHDEADATVWATQQAMSLAKRIGFECRFRVEVW